MSSEKDIFDNIEDDELDNIVTLIDEEGREEKFELLDVIVYRGEMYIVLLPVTDSVDADEVVILMVNSADGEQESYVSVEDDDTLEAVFEIFKEKFKNEFNFVD